MPLRSPRHVGPLVALLLVASCGGSAPDLVKGFKDPEFGAMSRASNELGCPAAQIEVADLGADTVGVSGCGKRGFYKLLAGGNGWVTGADPRADAGAPKP